MKITTIERVLGIESTVAARALRDAEDVYATAKREGSYRARASAANARDAAHMYSGAADDALRYVTRVTVTKAPVTRCELLARVRNVRLARYTYRTAD